MVEMIEPDLKKHVKKQLQQGDVDGALRTLQRAIAVAAAELADLHGILGGAHRRQGDLVAAASAYDDGFQIDSRYGAVTSYNALNRLLTRIMLAPESLSDPSKLQHREDLGFIDVRTALSELQSRLQSQVEGQRRDDFWAAGDLAVTAALNGDFGSATRAVQRFVSCSPPEFAWSAYRATIASLAQLDTCSKGTLERLEALLATAHAQV
jgi:tetratricopeptide (TPR) repeat protein